MSRELYTASIVLTAGRSTRMGEPKALLRFGKRTLLELAVQNAIDVGVRRLLAVIGHRAEEIRAAHSFTGLPLTFQWVVNLQADSPMIVSLQMALGQLSRFPVDAFFFQPVDFPLVTSRDFRLLLDAFSARAEDELVFIASHEEHGGHPVLCDASLIEEFLKLPPTGTARDVLRAHSVVYVDTGNAGVVEDMDTRDDYRRLRDRYNAREGLAGPTERLPDRFTERDRGL